KCNVALDGVSAEQVLVSVTLSLNGKSFVINLDSSIFTKMMGSLSAKSTPPIRAISIASVEASVPMKIAIKSEKIAFSQAVSLQVGDVIRLTHEIDEPVPVEVNGQRNYLKSYLVKS
ncbi:FliM/FliN family flagellar motor switch protein, partial [Pseudoalteromonas ruthenica]